MPAQQLFSSYELDIKKCIRTKKMRNREDSEDELWLGEHEKTVEQKVEKYALGSS